MIWFAGQLLTSFADEEREVTVAMVKLKRGIRWMAQTEGWGEVNHS